MMPGNLTGLKKLYFQVYERKEKPMTTKTITALFDTREAADYALYKLDQSGFTQDQVSLLVSEETRGKHFGIVEDDKSDEGAVAGAAIGGLTAALYVGLASAGAFFIPGLNLVVSGALIGSLAGLGAGAAAGGLIGALVGAGIPEHEAKVYEERVRKGGILVAISAVSDEEEKTIKAILEGSNAQSIKAMAA
jgi:hypothetical protein